MKTVQVKSGDTLSAIAKQELGSISKWHFLADVNNLTDPTRLRIGQNLVIQSESFGKRPMTHAKHRGEVTAAYLE